jgi:hypothetical protein
MLLVNVYVFRDTYGCSESKLLSSAIDQDGTRLFLVVPKSSCIENTHRHSHSVCEENIPVLEDNHEPLNQAIELRRG